MDEEAVKPTLDDADITKLITTKLDAGEADPALIIALIAMRIVPVLKSMASELENIADAIARNK